MALGVDLASSAKREKTMAAVVVGAALVGSLAAASVLQKAVRGAMFHPLNLAVANRAKS
jgi:hypothetical protein